MKSNHDKRKRPTRVAEPVQVYLQPGDLDRLSRLTDRLGATKSDVLRRSLEALETQTAVADRNAGARLALPTFAGNGLLPGVDLDDTAALLDVMGE
jgi:hypothetical protein